MRERKGKRKAQRDCACGQCGKKQQTGGPSTRYRAPGNNAKEGQGLGLQGRVNGTGNQVLVHCVGTAPDACKGSLRHLHGEQTSDT